MFDNAFSYSGLEDGVAESAQGARQRLKASKLRWLQSRMSKVGFCYQYRLTNLSYLLDIRHSPSMLDVQRFQDAEVK